MTILQRTGKHSFNKGFVLWLARTYFKELNPGADISRLDIESMVDGSLTCQENLSILEREYPGYQWKKINKSLVQREFNEQVQRLRPE